jgi:energy-coupling factor transport system permease protein
MLIESWAKKSLLQRLDVRTKVLGLMAAVVWSFLFQNPLYNLALAAGLAALIHQSKISGQKVGPLIRSLIPLSLFLILISGFSASPEQFRSELNRVVLFSLWPEGGPALSVGGILTGFNFVSRLLVMLLASAGVSISTTLEDFMLFLNQLRVPPQVAFVITTALRFIPTLDKKRLLILEAQKARGARINDQGSLGQIKAYLPVMVPLFVNSILIAEDLAKGMLNRGYGFTRSLTPWRELKFSSLDYLALTVLGLLVGAGCYLRLGLGMGII